jgi:HAD superfamily hydrolase (TIGR01509 family)
MRGAAGTRCALAREEMRGSRNEMRGTRVEGREGAPAPRRTIKGALLDVDGTLLDSNDAHARSWIEALEGEGLSLPLGLVRSKIGKGGDKLLWDLLCVDERSPLGHTIAERRKRIFRSRFLPHVRPLPGARALIETMKARGLALVVATSSSAEEVRDLLTAATVADLLPDALTKSDAAHSKPDADIVVAAAGRAGLPPDELLMLGDTPYDVEAATRAGVLAVALRSGGWPDEDLRGALEIYDDPGDLLRRYDSSPFGQEWNWHALTRKDSSTAP